MMIRIRRSSDRGHFDHGWLDTYHTFSFAGYRDPNHMGFNSLRVMNEDWVRQGAGFGTHPHRDMEIITYVLEGRLEHQDSLGNGSVIPAGSFQRITAGTGIQHSEFNPSPDEPVHLYQIWIVPERTGLEPSYEEWRFDRSEAAGRWRLVASRDGREGSMTIHQDASLSVASLAAGQELSRDLSDRAAWIQVVRGRLSIEGHTLSAGDGAAISDEATAILSAIEPAEVMLFEL